MYGRYSNKGKWHSLNDDGKQKCFTKVNITEVKNYTEKPKNLCKRCIKKENGTSENKRTHVPKPLKILLWDTTYGTLGIAPCYCCTRSIRPMTFEAGHNKAVANGGETTLYNLRCICSTCNKSMGTQNLEEFKNKYFPQTIPLLKTVNC